MKLAIQWGRGVRAFPCLLLAALAVSLASQPGFCADPPVALTQIAVAPETANPNLLDNASFEDTTADHLPVGWNWDKRNTTATATVDAASGHQGSHSLFITNGTAEGANVYGLLTHAQPIPLQAGQSYTLSAYVRSAAPGQIWIGGGRDWQFRLRVPPTLSENHWRRLQMTFVPGTADAAFVLRIGTDSPTAGVWIDDLKLEQGETATPDVPTGNTPQLDPASGDDRDEKGTITSGDGPWSARFDLVVPHALVGAQLKAIETGGEAGNSPLVLSQSVDGAAGLWRVTVHGTANAADADPRTVRLLLLQGDREIARSEVPLRFLSPTRALQRLAALRLRLPALVSRLHALQAKGQDVAYPLVSITILQNFVGYVDEDLRGTEAPRGFQELEELEAMAGRVDTELRATNAAHPLPEVPRWTGTQRPHVVGPSFVGPVAFPGQHGKPVERPIFFVGYGHFNQVRHDIEKFPGYGANIIQFEVGPSNVFPSEGVVSDTAIRETRALLDRAARAGVAVDLLISPHYMPQWMLDKYPDMRAKREGFLQYSLHAPEGQEFLKRYIALLLPPLRDSPALHSICLTNEPVNAEEPDANGLRDWQAYLVKRHGSIATLNERWGTHYPTFDDIPLPNPMQGATPDVPRPSPIWLEFVRFNQEFFANWHRMMADAVHAAAPSIPVMAKPMTWTFVNDQAARFGVDAQLFGAMGDLNGNDSFEGYTYGRGDFTQDFVGSEETCDLQRSVRDAPVFNSENHVINDRETRAVPAEHLRALLWQDALHGQSATTIWVWERSNDPKSDIYGNIMHHPAATEAVGRVAHDLNRFAPEVTALQRISPKIAILQSVTSAVWDGPANSDCTGKLYTALAFTGLPLGFVTERQLEAGQLPQAPLLLIPNVTHLSDAACATLQRYRGRIVFVGADGITRNEYDRPRSGMLKPVASTLPYTYGKSSWKDLWQALPQVLTSAKVQPLVQIGDANGKPLWGVEWRCTRTSNGLIVSLCNYRQTPVTLTLWQPGRPASASRVRGTPWAHSSNLLTGASIAPLSATPEAVSKPLQPLEVRLYWFPER